MQYGVFRTDHAENPGIFLAAGIVTASAAKQAAVSIVTAAENQNDNNQNPDPGIVITAASSK